MKRYIFGLAVVAGVALTGMAPTQSQAAACANGVYHAGCTGPNGAAVVRKPPTAHYNNNYNHGSYYNNNHQSVHCAKGNYHSGCVRTY